MLPIRVTRLFRVVPGGFAVELPLDPDRTLGDVLAGPR